MWTFEKATVLDTGDVQDFQIDGQQVKYFDLLLSSPVFEISYDRIDIGRELTARSATFATRIVVPVSRVSQQPDSLPSPSQLENIGQRWVATLGPPSHPGAEDYSPRGDGGFGGGGGGGGGGVSCTSYVQTMTDTRDPAAICYLNDRDGADCEYNPD
jgi:hypothetical protein